jgi:hypothetical protein
MKKLFFAAILCLGFSFNAQAQLILDEVNICEDPDVKFLQVWLEGISLSNAYFINASFGQRIRALSPDTRRLKDKKGNLEVYGIAEVFNILDANGFDFVTIEITGSGSGVGVNNIGSNMSISTSYLFKRREKEKK